MHTVKKVLKVLTGFTGKNSGYRRIKEELKVSVFPSLPEGSRFNKFGISVESDASLGNCQA